MAVSLMKLAATIARSLQADLQAELRDIERAVAAGMFLLVPQVKLGKRLDVARAAEHWSAQLPALIEQQLRSE
jgi:Family of unknown function (DUF6441)